MMVGKQSVFIFLFCCAVQLFVSAQRDTIPRNDTVKQLKEVTVIGNRSDNVGTVRSEISTREVEESRGKSLGELLQRATGVTVLQTGSTIFKPVIHGLHSQRILILNNGVRQEGQQWGSEHAPEIDPSIADKFTVLKGAGALKYGSDAIAGAVLIEPRVLPQYGERKGEVNVGWFGNNRQYVLNGMYEENMKRIPALSWRVQATHKRGGNSRTPDYWLWNTGLSEWNYSADVMLRKKRWQSSLFFSRFATQLGIFTGAHIGNLTDLQTAIQSKVPIQNIDAFSYEIERPKQEVKHYLIKSKTSVQIGEQKKLILQFSHQENVRQEYDRALITDRPELDLNIGTSIGDLSIEQYGKKGGMWQYGLFGMLQQNVWSGSRFFIPNFIATNGSGYVIHKRSMKDWLLEGGLRYDYRHLKTFRNRSDAVSSSVRNFNNFSGSFGATKILSAQSRIVMNMALAWRAPQVNELFVNGLHHGTASFEIGDSTLVAEKAYNFSIQWKYNSDSTWFIDVTGYHNFIDGFINLIPSLPPTLTLRGAYPTFRFTQTNARLYGFDISVQRTIAQRFQAGLKSSILWARDHTKNDWLMQMPANRFEAEGRYYFLPNEEAYVQVRYQYVARQTRVSATIPDYLPPPPGYGLTQFDFATPFQIFKKRSIFGLSVTNLLNVRYRDYMNRFRYFNDEIGRSINLRLKIIL